MAGRWASRRDLVVAPLFVVKGGWGVADLTLSPLRFVGAQGRVLPKVAKWLAVGSLVRSWRRGRRQRRPGGRARSSMAAIQAPVLAAMVPLSWETAADGIEAQLYCALVEAKGPLCLCNLCGGRSNPWWCRASGSAVAEPPSLQEWARRLRIQPLGSMRPQSVVLFLRPPLGAHRRVRKVLSAR